MLKVLPLSDESVSPLVRDLACEREGTGLNPSVGQFPAPFCIFVIFPLYVLSNPYPSVCVFAITTQHMAQ